MLTQLLADRHGVTHCYRQELSFDETAPAQQQARAVDWGPDTMREWRLDADPLPGITERRFGPEVSLDDATTRVLRDCGWMAEPVHNASQGVAL